jgi:hypothetical protein
MKPSVMTDHELQLKAVALRRLLLTTKYTKYAKGESGLWLAWFVYFAWFAVKRPYFHV